jgi:hypothetical protein
MKRDAPWLGRDEKGFNVAWHTHATAMIHIVPFDVDASKLVSRDVALNPVKFLENVKEVVELFDSNIFYPKVINNETKLDGTPFVVPETRGAFSFLVTFSQKAGSEEIIGY